MERQLANLTGLVQKALTHTPQSTSTRDYLQVPAERDPYARSSGMQQFLRAHFYSQTILVKMILILMD